MYYSLCISNIKKKNNRPFNIEMEKYEGTYLINYNQMKGKICKNTITFSKNKNKHMFVYII